MKKEMRSGCIVASILSQLYIDRIDKESMGILVSKRLLQYIANKHLYAPDMNDIEFFLRKANLKMHTCVDLKNSYMIVPFGTSKELWGESFGLSGVITDQIDVVIEKMTERNGGRTP